MNTRLKKGVIVAVIHLAMVASLGAKLLVDRATRPRVWARAAPFDPVDPIRGRYVRLRLEGSPVDWTGDTADSHPVVLDTRDGTLILAPASADTGVTAHLTARDGQRVGVVEQPVAFFIPEHVPDPSVRAADEELWVEVTLPKHGAPRPIRLGVRKDGVLAPLDLD